MKQPTAWTGVWIGALLTAPLIALFYVGWRSFGLPFVPFDLFDWLTRVLPGAVITLSIDAMVRTIRSLHIGTTAAVAKAAEHAMALLIFFLAGMAISAGLFAAFRTWRKHPSILGSVVGAIVGLLVLLVTRTVDQTGAIHPVIAALWTLGTFIVWGAADGLIYQRLALVLPVYETGTELEARSVERVDRRRFLIRIGAASATITVVGAVVNALIPRKHEAELAEGKRWSAENALPNADAAVMPAPGTRPEFTPLDEHYRIDIDAMPPVIDEKMWRLKVGGLVEQPSEFTLEDIRRHEPMHQFVTLSCISNPVGGDLTGTTRWTGVSVQRLLPEWRLKPSAAHLKISAADGFFETVALDTVRSDERVMLTYAWDGVPLPAQHGFPLRIYIPDRYGMKQPKWITSIEAIDQWEAGYWVVRGWDREARMKATSVIDTIAVEAAGTDAGGQRFVPVGGIAHAGARGISKVEVQVDSGQWREAELRTPLSGLTWVIWRYDMPFQAGEHTLTVRCTDGKGVPQLIEPAPPHPSGASGFDSKSARI